MLLIKSRPLILDPSLWASGAPFPSAGSSSIWSAPHCRETYTVVRVFPNMAESDRAKKLQHVRCGFLPADSAIEHAHEEHGKGKVPRVAHGDEHHVVMVL